MMEGAMAGPTSRKANSRPRTVTRTRTADNPYVKKPVLHGDGAVGHTLKCRKHPAYSPRVRKPTCFWCLALFYMVKV